MEGKGASFSVNAGRTGLIVISYWLQVGPLCCLGQRNTNSSYTILVTRIAAETLLRPVSNLVSKDGLSVAYIYLSSPACVTGFIAGKCNTPVNLFFSVRMFSASCVPSTLVSISNGPDTVN